MIDLFASLILALFALFWIAVQLAGWLIVTVIVASPIVYIVSRFTAPPR